MVGTGQRLSARHSKTKRVELFPHQEKALLSKRRFVGLIGGTGGGKTFFGPIWLSCEIAEAPEDQFMVVAPTYKLMTRATLPALQECFRGTCLQGELNISSGLYKLPQGGRIWLGTADRPESLEAGQYRAAWLDEAGQMKYMAWVAIQARLGLKRGRCLLTTTPYGMNWLYKNFYQLWRKGHRDYDVVSFESTDNPLYPKEEVERAKAELSPELFDMRYRGLFRKMEGLVYPDFHDDHICEPFEIPDSWDRRGGCDFGYINPHVNLKGALDPREDVLYVYEEYYGSRKELKEIAETMYDIPWLGDPEGRREIEELKGLGVDIKSGETAKTLCLAAVNARIRTDRLRIFTSCPHTLDEIDIYHFDPRTGKPSKQDDHCMDALAQLVWHFDGARIRKSRVHISRMPRHFSALAGDVDADEADLRVRQTMRRAKQPPTVRKAVMDATWREADRRKAGCKHCGTKEKGACRGPSDAQEGDLSWPKKEQSLSPALKPRCGRAGSTDTWSPTGGFIRSAC